MNSENRSILLGYEFDRTCGLQNVCLTVSSEVVTNLNNVISALFSLSGGETN